MLQPVIPPHSRFVLNCSRNQLFFSLSARFSLLLVMRQNWYQARIFCICVFNLEEKSWKMNGNNIFPQAIKY